MRRYAAIKQPYRGTHPKGSDGSSSLSNGRSWRKKRSKMALAYVGPNMPLRRRPGTYVLSMHGVPESRGRTAGAESYAPSTVPPSKLRSRDAGQAHQIAIAATA